jgi:hypothetical protein
MLIDTCFLSISGEDELSVTMLEVFFDDRTRELILLCGAKTAEAAALTTMIG